MGVKDFFGRLFKETLKPETRELSAVSLAERWSSYPSAGLTPHRLADIFREADQGNIYRQMELFEEMEEKDAHLTAILQTRKMAVLGKDYEVLPYGWTPEDERLAEVVGEMLYRIPNLEEAYLDLMDAIGKHFGHPAQMPRAGLPEEIGPVAAFLASRRNSYMTGANINVDGGSDFT